MRGKGKRIFWVTEIDQNHTGIVGKKCANLGQMVKFGLPVPPCFMVSIEAYDEFMNETGAAQEIQSCIGRLNLQNIGVKELEKVSNDIKAIIINKEMPRQIKEEIEIYYRRLCEEVGISDTSVSVRSSGVESRPGMFATYLGIKGVASVSEKIKEVWASAFETRAIAYRIAKGLPVDADKLGVAVVKMVNARAAGVSFSIDPVTKDERKVVIEAAWGLGEGVVSGSGTVDTFVIDKHNFDIVEKRIARKEKYIAMCEEGVRWEHVAPDKQEIACISDDEAKKVAAITKLLEEKMGVPQDVEWAVDESGDIFVLQTRPAKVAVTSAKSVAERMSEDALKVLENIGKVKPKMGKIEFNF